jgi:hypothetical protein
MPRATLRQILAADPRRMVVPLVLIAGVVGALGVIPNAPNLPAPLAVLGGPLLFAFALVVFPLGGVVVLYLFGWLLALTGRWLDGSGSAVALRAAIAWSNVPAIWGGLLLIPRFLTIDSQPADPSDLLHNPMALLLEAVLLILGLTLLVWQVVIGLKCVGEAHAFSAWRALGAVILSVILVGGGLLMLAVILGVVAGLLR